MDCRLDDKSDLQFFCVYRRGENGNMTYTDIDRHIYG